MDSGGARGRTPSVVVFHRLQKIGREESSAEESAIEARDVARGRDDRPSRPRVRGADEGYVLQLVLALHQVAMRVRACNALRGREQVERSPSGPKMRLRSCAFIVSLVAASTMRPSTM